MKKVVFLDTGVLGKVTHPRAGPESKQCIAWLLMLLRAGVRVCIPEVCDYELRRGYIHRNATAQLKRLDDLKAQAQYVSINTRAMREAAALWAKGRTQGRPTASDQALDCDVILCAQALLEQAPNEELVVATTDVADLSTFVTAQTWQDVSL